MAKRKRLNKRVVMLLVAIGLVAGLGVISYVIYILPSDPEALAREAKAAHEKEQYVLAVQKYDQAVGATRDQARRCQLMVERGQAKLDWVEKDTTLGMSRKRDLWWQAVRDFRDATLLDKKNVEARRQQTNIEWRIALGQAEQGEVNWVPYVESATQLLELVPDDNETRYNRAVAYAQLAVAQPAYVDPALKELDELIRRNPEEERYWLEKGRVYRRNEGLGRIDRGQVEPVYRQGLQANPESVNLRVEFADYLRQQDRKDEAMDLLRKAVEVKPTEPRGYLVLAQAHLRDKDAGKAKETLAQAIAAVPDDPRAYEEMARIHWALKETDKAEAVLIQGLETVEKSVANAASMSPAQARKYHLSLITLNNRLCDVLLDRLSEGGKKEETLPRIQAALEQMTGALMQVSGAETDHPWVERIEGRLALVDGDLIKAERLLRSAYDRGGFEARTAQLLINIYLRLNQPGEAEKIIQRFRALSPDNTAVLMELAKLNVGYRRFDQAGQNLSAVLKIEPDNQDALALKGVVDILTGAAESLPQGVTRIDPQSAAMLLARARQFWLEGEQPSAVRLVAEVFRLQPGNLEATYQLIQWYLLRDEKDRAKAAMDRAMAFYKDNPDVQERLVMLVEADPAARRAYSLKLAEQESDPVRRELRLAAVYAVYGDSDQQSKHLQEAAKLGPDNPAVVEAMFEYHLRKGEWDKAGAYADKAAQMDVDQVRGKLIEARLAYAQGKWDEAIALVNEAVRRRSRFSAAHAFLGDCYVAKRDYESARLAYDQAYQQDPGNVGALLGLVRVSELTRRTADYEHYVQLAYRFRPQDPEIRERYLRLRESRDEPEDIIRHREQVRRQQPANTINLIQLAQLYERVGRASAAEQAYKDVLSRESDNVLALSLLAKLLRATDRAAEGFSKLTQYADGAADKVEARLILADYLEQGGDVKAAANTYRAAIDADPKDPRGYANMARFSAGRGAWSDAVNYQRKFIEVAGEKAPPSAEETLIGFMIEAGQFADVDARLQTSLGADPNNGRLLALKGLSQFRQSRHDEALDALNRALNAEASHAQHAQTLLWRAEVHRAKGDMTRCVADLEAARQRDPSPRVIFPLARIYESMGDFANARAVLQSLLSERAGYEPALQELVLLCQRHNRPGPLEEVLIEARRLYPRQLFFIRAQVDLWLERGDAPRAVQSLVAVRKVLPQSTEINALLARAMVQAGLVDQAIEHTKPYLAHEQIGPVMTAVAAAAYAKKGRADLAEEYFRTALTRADQETQLGQIVGQITTTYGQRQAGRKLVEWASARPNDWQYRLLTASTLMTAEEYKLAKEQMLKGLELTDQPAERFRLIRQLALAHYQLKEFDDSLKRYVEAMGIEPGDSTTLNNLAWLLVYDLKRPEEALPHAEKAVRLQPYSPHALDTLGLVLTATGEQKKAEETLFQSISIEAMSANLLHLGELYEQMGRKDDAVRYYRQGWEKVKDKPEDMYHQALRDALKRHGELPSG